MNRMIPAALAAALFAAPLTAQDTDLASFVDSIASSYADAGQLAGMTVGVTRGDETLLLDGYGHADLEWDVPMPADAILEIGSVTKQFTSVAALMLWEQGRLDLDADLTTYLPDYDTQGHVVTVRQLFDHKSGIQGYTEMGAAFGELVPRSLPRDTLVTLFEAEPFQFAPGEAVIYNNSAFFLLGLIVEEISGQSYAEFLEEHVFPKAGMDDTSYCTNDQIWERRAHGYSVGQNGLVRAAYLDHTWPYAAGSLCSTAPDLLAWIDALHEGRVLSDEAYELLVTPEPLSDGTPTRYAKGMVRFVGDGGLMIAHGGGINGFLAETRYYPEEDAAVVVLVNATGPAQPGGIADAIGEHLFGTPEPPTSMYAGDKTALVGAYHGPVRGDNDATARVDLDDDGNLIVNGVGPTQQLHHLEGHTFYNGNARYTFLMDGDVPTHLQVDQIYGLYVLEAGEMGPETEAEVSAEVMQMHVGEYHIAPMGVNATVSFEDGNLYVQIPGQPRLRLVPDSDNAYHLNEVPASFTFIVEDGRTVAVQLVQGPADIRAERVGG